MTGVAVEEGLVLAVEDDERLLPRMLHALRRKYPHSRVKGCASAQEAFEVADASPVSAAYSDLRLPDHSGIDVLERIAERNPGADCYLVTGETLLPHESEKLRQRGFRLLNKKNKNTAAVLSGRDQAPAQAAQPTNVNLLLRELEVQGLEEQLSGAKQILWDIGNELASRLRKLPDKDAMFFSSGNEKISSETIIRDLEGGGDRAQRWIKLYVRMTTYHNRRGGRK